MKIQKNSRLELVFQRLEDHLFFLRKIFLKVSPELFAILPQTADMRQALNTGDFEQIKQIAVKLCAAMDYAIETKFTQAISVTQCLWMNFCNISAWHQESQRIYAPSMELLSLLSNTDLPEFSADEIHFVANSYIVKLEEAIFLQNSSMQHDFLLCSFDEKTGGLNITSYPPSFDSYKPFTMEEKHRIAKGGQDIVEKVVQKITAPGQQEIFSYTLIPHKKSYAQMIREVDPSDRDELQLIYQIAVGMNLYLQSNRKGDEEIASIIPHEKSIRGQSIVTGAKLFEFKTSKIIRSQRPSQEGPGIRSVPYHFRRGFWRRPKGQGQNPEAIATEWVRPTWVREDLKEFSPHVSLKQIVEA